MPKTLSWSLVPVTLLVMMYFFVGYDYSGAAQNAASADTGINYSEVVSYFADMDSNIVDETVLRANPIAFLE